MAYKAEFSNFPQLLIISFALTLASRFTESAVVSLGNEDGNTVSMRTTPAKLPTTPLAASTKRITPLLSSTRNFETTSKSQATIRWDEDCGRRKIASNSFEQNDLLNFSKSLPGAWPWHALLVLNGVSGERQFASGVIISDRWILVSTMLMDRITLVLLEVMVGATTAKIQEGTSRRYFVEKRIMHPRGYFPYEFKKDNFGLLKLNQSIQFNDYVQPICLQQNISDYTQYETCFSTGTWDRELYQAKMTSLSDESCRQTLNDYYHITNPTDISDYALCARSVDQTLTTCPNDVGGPMACKNSDGKWSLLGLGTHGSSNSCQFKLYTKISTYLPWIEETMVNYGA